MLSLPSPTKLQRQYCHRQYLVTHLLAVGCILALLPGHTTATVLHCTSPTTAGFTVTRSPTDWYLDVTITSTEHTDIESDYSDQFFYAGNSELVISEGLHAGTQYTISGNGTSSIQCITKPSQPVITDITSTSTSTITVYYTIPDAHVTSVLLTYTVNAVNASTNVDCATDTCMHSPTLEPSPAPGTTVAIRVQAVRGGIESDAAMANGATMPSAVSSITLVEDQRTTNSLSIQFTAVSSSVTRYVVEVNGFESATATFHGDVVTYTRNGLTSGTQYTFTVYTELSRDTYTFRSSETVSSFYTKPSAPTSVYAVDNTITTDSFVAAWTVDEGAAYDKSVVTISSLPESFEKSHDILQHQFSNLSPPGSSYTVSVKTTVGSPAVESDSTSETIILKPLAVSLEDITITSEETQEARLTWSYYDSADSICSGYNVRLLLLTDNGESEVATATKEHSTTSHTFTNLTPGTLYDFAIIAYSGTSGSEETHFPFYTKPLRPTLTTAADTHTITATMTPPIEGGCSMMWLYVDGSRIHTTDITDEPVEYDYSTGISPASTYELALKCVVGADENEQVEGDQTQTETVHTKPEPITHITIGTKTHDTLTFNWTGSDRLSYIVEILDSSGSRVDGARDLAQPQYTASGLEPGGQYRLNVQAVYNGVPSELDTELHTVTMYPLEPTDLSFEYRTQTSLYVTWAPPRGVVERYHIEVYQVANEDPDETVESDRPSVVVGGLTVDTEYEIRVYSLRQEQSLNYLSGTHRTLSSSQTGIMVDSTTEDSISVSWETPGGSITGYELSIQVDDIPDRTEQLSPDQTTYHFTQLSAGQTYTISLTVMTGSGSTGAQSRPVTTNPRPVVLGSPQTTVNSIVVTWVNGHNSAQDSYKVCYTSSETPNCETPMIVTATSATIPNLASGLTYTVDVIAVSNSAESSASSVTATTVPAAPTSLTFEIDGLDLRFSWIQDDNDFSDRFEYSCTVQELTSAYVGTTGFSATINNAFPGCIYTCHVRALSSDQTGTAITAATTIEPRAPSSFTVASYHARYIALEWDYDEHDACHSGFKIDSAQAISMRNLGATVRSANYTLLTPGDTYTFALYTAADDENGVKVYSEPAEITRVTKPEFTSTLTISQIGTTHLVLGYTENQYTYARYEFMINDPDSTVISKLKHDVDRSIRFNDLIPGRMYTVTASVWSETEQSSPEEFPFNTKPMPPDVEAEAIHGNWMTVRFYYKTNPEYEADEFEVECTNCPSGQDNVIRMLPTNNPRNYTGLTPHTDYSFTVIALTNGVQSDPATHILSTSQRAPGPVGAPIHRSNGCGRVIIEWPEPLQKNGVIVQYLINATSNSANPLHETLVQPFDSATLSIELTSLAIGVSYDVTIQAVTIAVGESQEIRIVAEEEQCKPDAQPIGSPATLTKNSTSSLQVTLVNPFNDKPDVSVMSYILLVIRSDERPSNSLLAQTPQVYGTVKGTSPPYIYQPFPSCATFDGLSSGCGSGSGSRRRRATQTTVDIGTDSDCEEFPFEHACNSNQNPTPNECFCNGALQDDSKYYILLRAIGNHGYYADSELSAPFVTAKSVDPPSDDGGTPTWVIILAVVVLIILVAAIVMAVCYVRRRGPFREQPRDTMRDMRMSPNHSSFSKRSVKKTKPSDFRRPVKVADFLEHFAKMSADTDYLFSIEYESLQDAGRDQQAIDAELPENRNKNRFTNILPYDTTRVKLLATDDVQGSDYINANYMPGHNSMREFIVTQGCMPGTRDDFWRMIWEQNCPAIVMLTKCVEKGREKCDHYWPMDSEPMFYGDLQVVSLNETKCPDWIVTEFRISLGDYSRNVKHFHFIAWPDFGIPEKPQALIKFVRLVRNKLMPDGGPVVVHCSAGVGRSGTFIALDRLLQQIKEVDTVDIYNLVAEMRFHRVCMVQTEGQYICIHRCLACVLAGQEHDDSYDYMGEDNDGYDDDEGITVDPN